MSCGLAPVRADPGRVTFALLVLALGLWLDGGTRAPALALVDDGVDTSASFICTNACSRSCA